MTAPAVIRSGAGLRAIQVLALNSDGYPDADSTVAYEGVTVSGAVSLTLDDPEPQQIVHRGDDRVFALDTLPPTDPISGELTVRKTNDTADAILTDDKSITVGEAMFFGAGTDNRGDENQVCVLAYQQTENTDPSSSDFGKRYWGSRLLPKAYVIPREVGLEEDTGTERAYTVRPLFIKKYPWGTEFSTSTEGFEQAQLLRGITEYKPKIVAYQGDNSTAAYTFPSDYPAASTDKITIWIDGTECTTATEATDGFTLAHATEATTGAIIVVFYEHE